MLGKLSCQGLFPVIGNKPGHRLLEQVKSSTMQCTHRNNVTSQSPGHVIEQGRGDASHQVGLVQHGKIGYAGLFEQPGPGGFVVKRQAVGHQQGDVGLLDDFAGAPGAQVSHLARVVKSGRVDEHTGAQGQDLHRLDNGIGGRAGNVAHQRHLLSREGIDKR